MENEGPPKDHEDDLPESSGTRIDQFFWWLWRTFCPQWLMPESKLANFVLDQIWIDCAWCMSVRMFLIGTFLSAILTASFCAAVFALLF